MTFYSSWKRGIIRCARALRHRARLFDKGGKRKVGWVILSSKHRRIPSLPPLNQKFGKNIDLKKCMQDMYIAQTEFQIKM